MKRPLSTAELFSCFIRLSNYSKAGMFSILKTEASSRPVYLWPIQCELADEKNWLLALSESALTQRSYLGFY